MIGEFGEKLFGKRLTLHKWIDLPLRAIKYILLAFFIYIIFFAMDALSLRIFLDSPYNTAADIKMWYFFADISQFSLIVISVLFFLSIIIRNFWCRYLCPYGALLGIFSLLSPNKIKREKDACINCSLCTKACPSRIKVEKAKYVFSDECTSCLNCVDACPVSNTLNVKSLLTKKNLKKKRITYGIVTIFISITGLGILTGNWNNKVTVEEYKILYRNIENLGHPTSTSEVRNLKESKNPNKKNYDVIRTR
jgi:polyferredoxin